MTANSGGSVARLGMSVLAAAGLLVAASAFGQSGESKSVMKTGIFAGKKVNAGFVTHEHMDGRHVLTLSDDFQVPETPDPHWQVVDSRGNAYLLQRLNAKGLVSDKLNRTITLPTYITDIASVQIWCAYAEVVLGEAKFPTTVK